MKYTKNLNLSKPSYDDDVDVQVLNNNMDILDDKIGTLPYLPLKGGTMSGDIKLPFDIGLNYDATHFLNFQQTNFKGNTKNTLATKADRFKFYCPSGKEFVVEDSGAWYNGDMIVQDLNTDIQVNKGYTKLSTGLLLQWGYATAGANDGNVQQVTFQTPFKNNQYVVTVSKSQFAGAKPQTDTGNWFSTTYEFTTTGFKVICDSNDTGKYWCWIAVGRA